MTRLLDVDGGAGPRSTDVAHVTAQASIRQRLCLEFVIIHYLVD